MEKRERAAAMRVSRKKKGAGEERPWREGFRWCEKQGRYLAVKVCENQAKTEKRCSGCYNEYLQLPLPFPGVKAG